jgi:hypothetical protein
MGFLPAEGYGNMQSYTKANIQADSFEVKNLGGTIMRKAFGQLVFSRFMNESRNAFGLGKGGTFTVPIFNDWGAVATVQPLVSGTAIGIGSQKVDSVSMTIGEFGTGIGYETQGDFVTNLDIRDQLTTTLGNHIARMVNWQDYDILVNNALFTIEVPSAGSYSSLLGTNRIGNIDRSGYGELGAGGLAKVYDTFRGAIASPVTQRGMYIAVGNARTFRNLKNGSVFQNQQLYANMRGNTWQVLGDFMGFTFVESEELTGNGTTLFLANNAGGYGFGQLPRTWYYPDYGQDAGRLSVWKTIYYRGQGAIWRDKGTTAILMRTNSSTYNYGSLG